MSVYRHTFHIPVMGTGFTIDTPLKVARYGISSVLSLVDDALIEQMRKYHSERTGEPYEEIASSQPDSRARRITAYLNLLNRLVEKQLAEVKASDFVPGSEITKYYELLPEGPLKQEYRRMLAAEDGAEKLCLQESLRMEVSAGSIDVNIMTKLDRTPAGADQVPNSSDASSALRGFALSDLSASVVFSAGMNQRLYNYAAQFDDFLPVKSWPPKKSIILKVSEYRSAEIQGKYLAKRGLWVSEFRIESGLNCGGHAFATRGHLMGPILEEFREKKWELFKTLRAAYESAIRERGIATDLSRMQPSRVTVQGGIGTAEEDRMLRGFFEADATGWGTPFLLVPEATRVDEEHLEKLARATEKDVYLSDSSPLGVPFWNLRTSSSEESRRERVRSGKPGSVCRKGFLVSNTEFTKTPICVASRAYQMLKLDQLSDQELDPEDRASAQEKVFVKSCICDDLAGGATRSTGIDALAPTAICPGPNIVHFSKIATLREMVDHIYGRISLLTNPARKHMFVQELALYLDCYRKEIAKMRQAETAAARKAVQEFKENLASGIEFYNKIIAQFPFVERQKVLHDLAEMGRQIQAISASLTEASALPA